MSKQPGYVSADIHKSLDGMRVTNYAQWRSREELEAMFRDPDAQAHMDEGKDPAAVGSSDCITMSYVRPQRQPAQQDRCEEERP